MLQMTAAAQRFLQAVLAQEPGSLIRIHIAPGCSGPRYFAVLEESASAHDTRIDVEGIPFVYPSNLAYLMEDLVLDCEESWEGPELVFRSLRGGCC
ncbi:iron-sulfur cluster biosynthesis family protein [Alicyclobacillus macrosporangiidus]|uniref:Iron-sulphur cluster biosynthesis n=1 Tax=Alicyclobacillus macrosporangiidus TaxID=392015 RepID=A0A1I7JRP9_9BACL|nr:iron-sulfur cluster biosynthesis family protein [Alicyclobacillus macrosporangiidus]SFU87881.1 Iron-sulphur cluster biosynthesis [Alicyclobacillus macrosporangiidus]